MPAIHFFNEGIKFKLTHPGKTKDWVKEVVRHEGRKLLTLNFIFCSDEHLLAINQQYLRHETLTDIITFDHTDGGEAPLEGDVFVSIDRVNENAIQLKIDADDELHRVMIHGVLHLLGYTDNTPGKKAEMREKEDAYLSLRPR